ncbi:MAG TPA: hypothetical protein VM008_06535 [Phycisphaerae bacterium]|nr:hypothetical protein [Phycisphaerae bacterium]
MNPILLIHGYSAESPNADPASVKGIYANQSTNTNLPDDLRQIYQVVEIDLSRYISLNDSVSLNDISRALDRALRQDYPSLLQTGFNVIIHSTGALVIRNWVRLFSPKPSPIINLIHLAGANFGSGWASIGQGQIARWGRFVFQDGAQRGVKVLQALELGSSDTIDLHLQLTQVGSRMLEDYGVQEYVIIGTQADPSWFEFPIRYAKEDGSDGTVRVSGGNLNFNYLSIVPNIDPQSLRWQEVQLAVANASQRAAFPSYYKIGRLSRPYYDRAEIPFAIPFECAHSGDTRGIVAGTQPKAQVQRLIQMALNTPRSSPALWAAHVNDFHNETTNTYNSARTLANPGIFKYLTEPRRQYDPHAQIIFRLRDQDDQPVPIANADIFFVSDQQTQGALPVQSLIEDTVVNDLTDNCMTFYLRVGSFNPASSPPDWEYQLGKVGNFAFEITAIDPRTNPDSPSVLYLPIRIPLTPDDLADFIQAHRTTIVDVQLLRVPSPAVYTIVPG